MFTDRSIRARFQPFRHISIPLHQVTNGQRSFWMLGNDAFEDGDLLADHAQIALRSTERAAYCLPAGDYPAGQHHSAVSLVLIHTGNIPAATARVNWEAGYAF